MPKPSDHIETRAIHDGMNAKSSSKSVVPPIEVSTIYEHSEQGHQDDDYLYSRHNNPNRSDLESVLASLEQGAAALAFSSGVAAISALIQGMGKGSHIIIPSDVYHGTRVLMQEFSKAWSIDYDEVDFSNLANVESAVKDNTRLILIETPSNPRLIITDIEAVVSIAKKHHVMTACDNTWPTPLNLNPISFGVDFVIHSTTKYLGGHSDIIGGALVFNEENEHFESMKKIQIAQGAVPSPRDAWLLTRSIRSFPYRMRGHNANAEIVAEYLAGHSQIEKVFFPGLATHPGHEIAKAQMNGFGGMISFLVKGNDKDALKVVASSKLISRATSLGGVESTWEHRFSSEGEASPTPPNLIRLSVGLEHPDDIIADLETALNVLK